MRRPQGIIRLLSTGGAVSQVNEKGFLIGGGIKDF